MTPVSWAIFCLYFIVKMPNLLDIRLGRPKRPHYLVHFVWSFGAEVPLIKHHNGLSSNSSPIIHTCMRFHFILNFIRKSRKEIITRYPFHLIHRIDVLITFFSSPHYVTGPRPLSHWCAEF